MPPTGRDALPPIVRALLSPDAYTHAADAIRLHETHISWVVLAGDYAYKVKKPVNFGFLDFSTVERRAAACADEVRLNRRLSPETYLGVRWLTAGDDGFRVNGDGALVEPLVQMRRLPEEGMLPALLARGEGDARLVRSIARRLARFHARAATGAGVDEYGSLATVRANWEENFAQMAPFLGTVLSPDVNARIETFVQAFLKTNADLFDRRVREGRVREGHGDLHAASICVVDRRPRFFDCLEFSARFRCSDVAAEVGFLAMDLDHYGRADLGDAFVSAYVRAAGDADLRLLLPFYLCYRAYVRGKIRCLRLSEGDAPPEETARITAEARAYFDLAWAYAGGLTRPLLLVAMGLPASGKSSLARGLAGRLGLVSISSDVVRKALAGLRPTERRVLPAGEGLYADEMTRRTYAALRRRAGRWLRRGRSVVLDATYGRAEERGRVRALARRLGVPLLVFQCSADEATLRARLAAREGDAAVVSDARLSQWPALLAAFEPPVPGEAIALDTTGTQEHDVEAALTLIRSEAGAVGVTLGVAGQQVVPKEKG